MCRHGEETALKYFTRIMGPRAADEAATGLQPERERRAAMNEYAQLQIFKLKVVVVLIVLVIALKWR
jgi:hypothetical protein